MIADVRRSSIIYSLLALFSGALIVRLPVLDWGGVNPDENTSFAAKVLTGELSSYQQYYPPLLNYLVALAYAFYYVLGRALGWWDSTAAFRAAYFEHVTQFYVIARLVIAALSSTAAPLTFLLSLNQGIRLRVGLLISAIVAFFPAGVFWSQIAKSDGALGPAFLLVVLTAFRLQERPCQITRQIPLGCAIAIALSFKQSAVFFLVPIICIIFIVTFFSRGQNAIVLRAWVSTGLFAVLTWIPLNIGILLNIHGFINAQIVQSEMSLRSSYLRDSLVAWFATITSEDAGVPLAILVIWACTPIFYLLAVRRTEQRFKLLTMWASVMIAMILILYTAGNRQNSQLLLPYSVVMTSTVLVLAGHFIDASSREFRVGAGVLLAGMAIFFSADSMSIIRQARAEPVARNVAAAVESFAQPGTRLLADIDMTHYLPVSSIGAAEMRARNERLAAKYSVLLPPVAGEHLRNVESGYTVRGYPFVIGGLENVAAEDIKVVLPFAWPLQPEEWQLSYWLARDYHMFVFQETMLHHPVAAYRDFFSSIDQKCARLSRIPTNKPLVLEDTMLIYRCY